MCSRTTASRRARRSAWPPPLTPRLLPRRPPSAEARAPARDRALAGLEPDQTLAAAEGVRRAGHRLHAEPGAAALRRERVAGVELEQLVALVHPQFGDRLVGALQAGGGEAGGIAEQRRERAVDLELADLARCAEVERPAVDLCAPARELALRVGQDHDLRGQLEPAFVDDAVSR